MIVVDTSVMIDWDHRDLPDDHLVSSAVVLAELHFGVATARGAEQHSTRRSRIAKFESARFQWLPYSDSTAAFHAELMHATHGHAPAKARSRDLMIAATAYELGASLATLNPDDFRYIAHLVPVIVPPARQ